MNRGKKLAINSLVMYSRMLIIMIITLYISRLSIDYLGIEKFGLFSVISGIVVFGTLITSVLENTAQRYYSEELAKGEDSNILSVIRNFLSINVIVGLFSILVVEVVGLWFIKYKLDLSSINVNDVYIIFNISLLGYFINVITSPILSIFISHEKVKYYAYVSTFEIFLKLFLLINIDFFNGNKIIIYAIILCSCVFISRLLAYFLAKYKFKRYIFIPSLKIDFLKSVVSYIFWNLFGSLAAIVNNQGINILLNVFFGLTVNTARTISTQISSAINQIINSVQVALNPQIVKSYINKEYKFLSTLLLFNSKIASYLAMLIIVLIYNNINFLLDIWLNDYPKNTILFINLILIDIFIVSFSSALVSLVQATGNIKKYQIVVGCTMMINLPLSYYLLLKYNEPSYVYISSIIISIVSLVLRLWFVKKLNVIKILTFIYEVILKSSIILLIVLIAKDTFIQPAIDSYSLILNFIYTISITFILIFLIGFNLSEKKQIILQIRKRNKNEKNRNSDIS